MAELGWAGLVLPPEHGGAGLGWLHLALLLEEHGRALLCSPLLATIVAGIAVDLGGSESQRAALLPALASTSDALALAVRRAVQLHGGIGFTWECDVHFYFRRAMWLRATLGDARHHRRHLRSALLERMGHPTAVPT